jgi:hypothetical protein
VSRRSLFSGTAAEVQHAPFVFCEGSAPEMSWSVGALQRNSLALASVRMVRWSSHRILDSLSDLLSDPLSLPLWKPPCGRGEGGGGGKGGVHPSPLAATPRHRFGPTTREPWHT